MRARRPRSTAGTSSGWRGGRPKRDHGGGYARSLVPRIEDSSSLLDVQTGGAEVLCEALGRARRRPMTISATDAWPPNVAIARRNLAPLDGNVFEVGNDADLPFASVSFDLVTACDPVVVRWDEIARVLVSGGTYFAQHVGPGSNRELTNFVMGPQPVSAARSAAGGVRGIGGRPPPRGHTGSISTCRVRRHRCGRLLPPQGSVDRARVQRRHLPGSTPRLHDHIVSEGQFVSHSTRFLIELRKPER